MTWDGRTQYYYPTNYYGTTPVHPGALPQQPPQQPTAPVPRYQDPRETLRGYAKASLVYGILNCTLFFFMAYIMFTIVADPTSTTDILGIGQATTELLPYFMVYFVFVAVYGIMMAALGQESTSGRKVIIFFMTVLPGILCMVVIGLLFLAIPYIRGVMISVPLVGLALGASWKAKACFPGHGLPVHRTLDGLLVAQGIGTVAFCELIEAFYTGHKAQGAIAVYIGFVALGLLMLYQGLWAYTSTIIHLAPPEQDQPAKKPRFKGDPTWNMVVIFIVVTAILALAFKPPLESYFEEPQLRIQSADCTEKGRVWVTVINKAGTTAYGHIQLWVNNSTKTMILDETDSIEGFGRWEASRTYTSSELVIDKKLGADVNLTVDGKEVSKMHAKRYYSGDCMIPISWIFIGVGSVVPYFSKRRLRRYLRENP